MTTRESTPNSAQPSGEAMTSRPAPPSAPPALGPVELARWAWRQLTSMRTALILLFLLALAVDPGLGGAAGGVDSVRASQWREAPPQR